MKKFIGAYVDFYDNDLKMVKLECEDLEEAIVKMYKDFWFKDDREGFEEIYSINDKVNKRFIDEMESVCDCSVKVMEA